MGIAYARTRFISRKAGQSVVAAAAYRSGTVLHDELYGTIHNYKRKEKVEAAEIVLPAGAPAWMADREKLWNSAEAAETRKDSRLARELVVALPNDLPVKTNRRIVEQARHIRSSSRISTPPGIPISCSPILTLLPFTSITGRPPATRATRFGAARTCAIASSGTSTSK